MRDVFLPSGLHGGSPMARWSRLAVAVAAAAGYAAGVHALRTLSPPDVAPWWWIAAAALIALPLAIGAWGSRGTGRGRLGVAPLALLLVWVIGAGSIARLGLGHSVVALLLIALLMILQGFQLAQVRSHGGAARASLWMSLCQVFCALAVAPGPTLYLLLPLCLGALVVGLVLLHGREVRRRVEHALRDDVPDEGVPALARRVTFATSLTLLLLVLASFAYPVAAKAPWTYFAAEGPKSDDGRRRSPGQRPGSAGPDLGGTVGTELDPGGVPLPTPEIFLFATPFDGGRPTGNVGPIYLRGLALSRFTRHGIGLSHGGEPALVRDADDGTSDGWVVLPGADPALRTLEMELRQFPLRIEPEGWALLYGPAPLHSVEMESVGYDPHRMLVSGPSRRNWFTYRVRGRHPGLRWSGLDLAAARHPDPRYLELPDASDDLAWIEGRAAAIVAGARTDVERVRRIERHFQTTFTYELQGSSEPGTRGLAQFMRRKRGYCQHFASAATLMLRTQGIPARVVTGFLAREWSEEFGRYVVGGRDMHAWMEVHFEGVGWVPFDATPVAPAAAALAAQRRLIEPDAGTWAGGLGDRIGDWLDDRADLADVVDEIIGAVPVVMRAVARRPLALGAYLLTLASLAVVWLLRRRAETTTRRHRPRSEGDRLYDRLLAALARRGYRKRSAQTPREFALDVARRGGAALEPIVPITERFYAERFGGRPLDAADRNRVLLFLDGIRRDAE